MHRLLPIGNPPTWHAPKLSPLLVRLGAPLLRLALRHAHRISSVEVRGLDLVEERSGAGHGVLITPNHVTYSDPLLLAEAAARIGRPFYYMTAWQVFAQSLAKRVGPRASGDGAGDPRTHREHTATRQAPEA